MLTTLLTLAIFLCAVAAMALGVIVTGRRLQGSCGGADGGACLCKDKGASRSDCPRKRAALAPSSAPVDPPQPAERASKRSLDVLPD